MIFNWIQHNDKLILVSI